jgi:chromosome segregation ATPase
LIQNLQAVARPYYTTYQELDIKLYNTGIAIETSWKKLYNNKVAINTYNKILKKEQEIYLKYSQVYNKLYQQYRRMLAKLGNISSKCLSLYQELEQAQETILAYKIKIAEYKLYLSKRTTPGDVKDQGD